MALASGGHADEETSLEPCQMDLKEERFGPIAPYLKILIAGVLSQDVVKTGEGVACGVGVASEDGRGFRGWVVLTI